MNATWTVRIERLETQLPVGMERASSRAEFEALRFQAAETSAFLQTLTHHGDTHASLTQ